MKEFTIKFAVNVALVVHWNGKIMEDLSSKQYVDRLPVYVMGEGICQLLGVPKLTSDTGEEQASAENICWSNGIFVIVFLPYVSI